MRRETDFIHGICEFCRRMDSAYPGTPKDDIEVKLVEHISCREFLALRGFARDLCTGISRFLAYSRENETVSIAMRIKDHGLYLCNYYDRQKSYGTIATADREKNFLKREMAFQKEAVRITFDRYHRLVPDILAAFALSSADGCCRE